MPSTTFVAQSILSPWTNELHTFFKGFKISGKALFQLFLPNKNSLGFD